MNNHPKWRKTKMCNAFSCIVMKDTQVHWRLGLDSHDKILSANNIPDIKDTESFVRVEISPENESYLKPNKWVFKIDQSSQPVWWSPAHKAAAYKAFNQWKHELSGVLVRKKSVHPFKLRAVKRVTKNQIKLLKKWASVGDSVGDSVRDSVGDSVRAYTGSFFKIPRNSWKYTENIDCGDSYPFQPLVDLWDQGLVPSFDGKNWRLHTGKDAHVIYEITKEDLVKNQYGENRRL